MLSLESLTILLPNRRYSATPVSLLGLELSVTLLAAMGAQVFLAVYLNVRVLLAGVGHMSWDDLLG